MNKKSNLLTSISIKKFKIVLWKKTAKIDTKITNNIKHVIPKYFGLPLPLSTGFRIWVGWAVKQTKCEGDLNKAHTRSVACRRALASPTCACPCTEVFPMSSLFLKGCSEKLLPSSAVSHPYLNMSPLAPSVSGGGHVLVGLFPVVGSNTWTLY